MICICEKCKKEFEAGNVEKTSCSSCIKLDSEESLKRWSDAAKRIYGESEKFKRRKL